MDVKSGGIKVINVGVTHVGTSVFPLLLSGKALPYPLLSTILSLREYKKCFNDIPAVFVCRVDLADTQPPYQKYYMSYMKVTLE